MSKFERIEDLKNTLFYKKYIKPEYFLNKYSISKRTFLRDIQELKSVNIPVKYCKETNTYIIKDEKFENLFLEEKNLLFYIFLNCLVENENYVPFAIKEVLNSFKKNINNNYSKLLSRIKYQSIEYSPINLSIFRTFIQGFIENKKIQIEYEDGNGLNTKRNIELLYFINYSNQWYFIAFDNYTNEIRNFLLSRVKNAILTDEETKFCMNQYDLEKYINNTYGIFKRKTIKNVKIRFYEPVYYLVKDKIWHKEQLKNEYTNSENKKVIEFTIPVEDYDEILFKVLGYQPYAEALEPQEFREIWLERIKESYNKYIK